MKKLLIALMLSLSVFAAFAQDKTAPAKSFWNDPLNDPMLPFYVVVAVIIVVTILILITGILMIRMISMVTEQVAREQAKRSGVVYKPRESWWSRFSRKANAYVPLEEESTIEMEHSFDGIKELDNHLPPWWKWLFYFTIAWSVVYFFIYHVTDTYPLMIQEYDDEVSDAEMQIRKIKALQPQEAIDENTLTFTSDQVIIGKGKEVFNTMNCGSCHRPDGGGNSIGPNLTDEFWIHGGDIKQVFNTIKNGAVDKGMPAWGKSLSPQDVRNVTFFVLSLQGTNPPNGKAPQGEKFVAPVTEAKDSTTVQASL